jgi:hypothetical protein
MAKSRKAGMEMVILFERGLTEWLYFFSKAVCEDATGIFTQNRDKFRYEASELASDIVVIFANIIQEARQHGIRPENSGNAPQTQSGAVRATIHDEAGL